MPRFALVLVFLSLIAENGMMYTGLVHTPLGDLNTLLFAPTPLKLPLFFFIVAGMLATGPKASKAPSVVRMRKAILISLGTLGAATVYGVATGGEFQQVPWQIFNIVAMSLFALVLFDAVRTTADVVTLGKLIVAAAIWRAIAGVLFYLIVARSVEWDKAPPYMTTHDDTVLFVTGIIICLTHALNTGRSRTTTRSLIATFIIVLGVQVNSRRLAWASLVMGLVCVYFVLPADGEARRRVNRAARAVLPIVALYCVVGWGRPEPIFKPLAAFSSMSDGKKDGSTMSREAENDNLVTTASSNLFIGRGFGHKFDAVNRTYELDGIFDQWQYIPHNSFLGLLAFTGVFGFAGIWWPLPACAFLAARSARFARGPIERTAAAVAVAEVIVYANQAYGDMGLNGQTPLVLVASAYAAVARISVTTGSWGREPRPPAPKGASVQPRPA